MTVPAAGLAAQLNTLMANPLLEGASWTVGCLVVVLGVTYLAGRKIAPHQPPFEAPVDPDTFEGEQQDLADGSANTDNPITAYHRVKAHSSTDAYEALYVYNSNDVRAFLQLPSAPNVPVSAIWGHPNTISYTPAEPWNQALQLRTASDRVHVDPTNAALFSLLCIILVGALGWLFRKFCRGRRSRAVATVDANANNEYTPDHTTDVGPQKMRPRAPHHESSASFPSGCSEIGFVDRNRAHMPSAASHQSSPQNHTPSKLSKEVSSPRPRDEQAEDKNDEMINKVKDAIQLARSHMAAKERLQMQLTDAQSSVEAARAFTEDLQQRLRRSDKEARSNKEMSELRQTEIAQLKRELNDTKRELAEHELSNQGLTPQTQGQEANVPNNSVEKIEQNDAIALHDRPAPNANPSMKQGKTQLRLHDENGISGATGKEQQINVEHDETKEDRKPQQQLKAEDTQLVESFGADVEKEVPMLMDAPRLSVTHTNNNFADQAVSTAGENDRTPDTAADEKPSPSKASPDTIQDLTEPDTNTTTAAISEIMSLREYTVDTFDTKDLSSNNNAHASSSAATISDIQQESFAGQFPSGLESQNKRLDAETESQTHFNKSTAISLAAEKPSGLMGSKHAVSTSEPPEKHKIKPFESRTNVANADSLVPLEKKNGLGDSRYAAPTSQLPAPSMPVWWDCHMCRCSYPTRLSKPVHDVDCGACHREYVQKADLNARSEEPPNYDLARKPGPTASEAEWVQLRDAQIAHLHSTVFAESPVPQRPSFNTSASSWGPGTSDILPPKNREKFALVMKSEHARDAQQDTAQGKLSETEKPKAHPEVAVLHENRLDQPISTETSGDNENEVDTKQSGPEPKAPINMDSDKPIKARAATAASEISAESLLETGVSSPILRPNVESASPTISSKLLDNNGSTELDAAKSRDQAAINATTKTPTSTQKIPEPQAHLRLSRFAPGVAPEPFRQQETLLAKSEASTSRTSKSKGAAATPHVCNTCGATFTEPKPNFAVVHDRTCKTWKNNWEKKSYLCSNKDTQAIGIKFPPHWNIPFTQRPDIDPTWLVTANEALNEHEEKKKETPPSDRKTSESCVPGELSALNASTTSTKPEPSDATEVSDAQELVEKMPEVKKHANAQHATQQDNCEEEKQEGESKKQKKMEDADQVIDKKPQINTRDGDPVEESVPSSPSTSSQGSVLGIAELSKNFAPSDEMNVALVRRTMTWAFEVDEEMPWHDEIEFTRYQSSLILESAGGTEQNPPFQSASGDMIEGHRVETDAEHMSVASAPPARTTATTPSPGNLSSSQYAIETGVTKRRRKQRGKKKKRAQRPEDE